MKLIVKDKYLNVRVGRPSINAPCSQYIAPGSEIEVDGLLYKGDPYESIDTWFKDEFYKWAFQKAVDLVLHPLSKTGPYAKKIRSLSTSTPLFAPWQDLHP